MADNEDSVEDSVEDSENSSVSFDERLSDSVRKYPILYDKSLKDFKDKHKKNNAWSKVAKELGVSSGKLIRHTASFIID